ncbi:hypothetical protein RHMOL_Rhmol01G0170600 [Rhododendron molle]|uniref:Uncharacterized protein n=1 Tax=Rhododendron molle TaxID=49168 RepID=A0ACC0Q213_RHOML|nr:hypothetical protein RHMOL_Rhmol01G0170600 [Rhododendron molle]
MDCQMEIPTAQQYCLSTIFGKMVETVQPPENNHSSPTGISGQNTYPCSGSYSTGLTLCINNQTR